MNDLTLQALLNMKLKPAVGWLYLHMAAKAKDNMLDATHEELAALVSVTRQTVRGYLLKLESKSLIQDVGGGRYVVRGLVHPPKDDVKKVNIKPESNVKHFPSDTDSERKKIIHATGNDVKKVNISAESESETLSLSDSDSESQTLATNVKHQITAAAVALWGEMPKSWHELLDEYTREFGGDWVLATLQVGLGKTGSQRPRHPRWLRAVIENGIQEGKTAATLVMGVPSAKAWANSPKPQPMVRAESVSKQYPPMPEGWMPDIWRPGQPYYREDRPAWMFKLAWECHIDASRVAS